MGYYAGTVYTQINISKNTFAVIEKRYRDKLHGPCPIGRLGNTWLQYLKGDSESESARQKAQIGLGIKEILSSFGFEAECSKDGNIHTLDYPDTSWNESSNKFILDLLEGLVDEGDHFEWLGSEGDDNRWINIHKNGKWETHDGYVEVKYSSDIWGTKPTEKQYIRCSKCSCTELHHEEVS